MSKKGLRYVAFAKLKPISMSNVMSNVFFLIIFTFMVNNTTFQP